MAKVQPDNLKPTSMLCIVAQCLFEICFGLKIKITKVMFFQGEKKGGTWKRAERLGRCREHAERGTQKGQQAEKERGKHVKGSAEGERKV